MSCREMENSTLAFVYNINAICACCKCDVPQGSNVKGTLNNPFVGLGYKNNLPWKTNEIDMKYFNKVTVYTDKNKYEKIKEKRHKMLESNYNNVKEENFDEEPLKNIVVMGRVTWESLPTKFRPLKNRINVIMSKSMKSESNNSDVVIVDSVDELLQLLSKRKYYKCFIIGGSFIYEEFLKKDLIYKIFYTRINNKYECDRFFPILKEENFKVISVSDVYSCGGVTLDFLVLQRKGENEEKENEEITQQQQSDEKAFLKFLEGMKYKNAEKRERDVHPIFDMVKEKRHPEYQYLNILCDILQNGNKQDDRTGVGVMNRFGYMMRFQISDYFPLLTTKKLFLRGIIEELLWFVRGETNGNTLLEKNVRIWEANGTREFLDNRKLFDREVNDLGPIYGFQWRHFGAEYKTMHDDYTNQGVDQLKNIIDLIKNDPTNRRILLCAWNPKDLEQMALPPCHILCQFYVFQNKLSCIMYQRSCDLGLGVPFNIASYTIFTYMIAQVCNLEPYEFIHVLGNAHIYNNHIEQLKTQINRIPFPFPTLKLNPNVKNIEDFTVDDFKVENYVHHDKIAMQMAA